MTQQNAIVPISERQAIDDVKRLANIVLSLRDQVFKDGLDFGIIPGTGNKPTLLLPGMEKLMRALHLRPEYVPLSQIEDFEHNRIFYRYECRLIDYDTGMCLSTAIGSANSHESKWRWRDQKRACPKCGKETINKSKFPPKNNPNAEPGWYCHAKAGGCGAEFAHDDATITGQVVGRIENPDIFDQMNTIDKIAQKRALSSAIKGAANVSEFFTVDLEDFVPYETRQPAPENIVEGTFTEVSAEKPSASVRGAGVQKPPQQAWADDPEQWQAFLASAREKLTMTEATVVEVLEVFEALDLGDWRTSKSWALAALIADNCENDVTRIDETTARMTTGMDEGQAFALRNRANQIAAAMQAHDSIERI